MSKGESSRKRILAEAFRLFATMPYERVSFSVMEKEIGISRGSMVYYFKNKEGLFREMITTLVLGTSSIKAVPEAYWISLRSFYNYYIEVLEREKESFSRFGIKNMNEALMRIENSALTYIDGFRQLILQWYDEEINIWSNVVSHAISIGEIRGDIDVVVVSKMFEETYLGQSFRGVFLPSGYDTETLKRTYDEIYHLLLPQ